MNCGFWNVKRLVPQIVKPKPPSSTSIPATLKTMQDEWDALMLHTFSQRQQLQNARQELSHALYQHDAACRVIARLNKEVTAAREALATLKPQAGIQSGHTVVESNGVASQQVDQLGMTPEIVEKLQDKATILTQERKRRGRTVPEELVTPETVRSFTRIYTNPVNTLCFYLYLLDTYPIYVYNFRFSLFLQPPPRNISV